jgi:hypothetical protein
MLLFAFLILKALFLPYKLSKSKFLSDHFKHELRAKFYIRYVDDFIILSESRMKLEEYKKKIDVFLLDNLNLSLHPDKSNIIIAKRGVKFLGVKIFPHHKLTIKRNIRKFQRKLEKTLNLYQDKNISYDEIYDFLEGWNAHSKNANMHNYKTKIFKSIEKIFQNDISLKEINRYEKFSKQH